MKKQKKFIAVVSLVVFTITMVLITFPSSASASPTVRVNGELRNFSSPPLIVNDRTMIPIRFVIEDEALQGQVYWDEGLHKIAIDCRGKYIELFIGSNQAQVDGKTVYLDAPPFIDQDRTYIPLRFLSENLGAFVGWNSLKREVTINFDLEPQVFAYYYYPPRAELKNNIHLFTDIAFRWFETNDKGNLFYEYKDDYAEVLKIARDNGVKTHASVVLMDRAALHKLLSSSKNRAQLIGNLMDKVKADNYDGVNIDFEFIDYRDAALFTTFLEELKTAMGPDKDLSVAVFARTGRESWPTPYQYKKIGEIADLVVVMAYDYSYNTSAPGPVAPLWWVQEVADYMTERIPREKIIMGVPTYGYDWPTGRNATTITAPKLGDIKWKYSVEEHFDTKSMSPYYTYRDNYNNRHQIWLENERSLQEKWNLIINNQLGGISFWRIGNGFDDLYKVLDKNLK
ncbi:MAG: glycosyl hydrolase family 18 protein [Syntrophomonadaceae bacterium]|nr:glycosyl hydrolase family 18 protein [Syntrophomonadaceae bacterium]MDD3889422.1 glycosyl hydrolase family 18 protein [Syntrophomonadaceae bacterium]MDD4548398.1 glycosyl hydrolase family 18 protein [Syntrophomonadaceae bacterium]